MNKANWKVAGTYVTGLSHLKYGKPCQDRYAFKQICGVTSISIADGAGSAKFAEEGAMITSKQINNTLVRNFDQLWESKSDEARYRLTHALRTRLGIYAKRKSESIKEFASTLIFASVKDNKYIAGHIGDGILGYLENDSLNIISPPDNGEFINETFFVTSNSYKERFRLFKGLLNNINGFVLMTDGTCESLFDKKERTIAPIVKTMFQWLDDYPCEEVNQALYDNFENVIKSKTTDDCSIGLMKLSSHKMLIDNNELIIQ